MNRQRKDLAIDLTHSFAEALEIAQQYAKHPRVSCVVTNEEKSTFNALPGYMDKDTNNVKQIALVTPDGRVWVLREL